MRKDVQNIRKSQYVLTYGPGSIIESQYGSRVIPSIDTGLSFYIDKEFLEKNEIDDIRMSTIIETLEENSRKKGIGLFTLPSNASLKLKETRGIYNTFVFPVWKLCFNKKHKYPILFNSFETENCPICGDKTEAHVRFVCACPDGHLDEVYWDKAVHYNKGEGCGSNYFYWKVNGSSLSSIRIECPICRSSVTMNEIYKMNFSCTGRFPEKERPKFEKGKKVYYSYPERNFKKCNENMRVIQKQSTSLRLPSTVSLLRIPKYEHPIFNLLNDIQIKTVIKTTLGMNQDYDGFITFLKSAAEINNLSQNNINSIQEYIEDVGFDEFKELFKKLDNNELTFKEALLEEFYTLNGGTYCKSLFCKGPHKNYNLKINGIDFPLKISPIEKMKTVTAQIGYTRKPIIKQSENSEMENNKLIYSSFSLSPNDKTWYPAYESMGEGIFITSEENPISYLKLNNIADTWEKNKPIYKDQRRGEEVKNPIFIWWHTLSHTLIKALSLLSGYSSTSLRERVYLNGETGGIFIYNTSPGDDSGMGGLVDLVDDFNPILDKIMDLLTHCSNDPICGYSEIMPNKVNGAACHNCLLISETSCEHGNMWLDRHFFIGD